MGRDRFRRKPEPERLSDRDAPHQFGVYAARVVDNVDPEGEARVKIHLPLLPRESGAIWARLAVPDAGAERGVFFLPEIDDEVVVAFEAGDIHRPVVLGRLWGPGSPPPEPATPDNNLKVIRTRSGIHLSFDDAPGDERIEFETPGGSRVVIEDFAARIRIEDSSGNRIRLDPAGITIESSAKVNVNAATVEVSAGMLNVNAGMAKFSGVVQADTVITNSVVSASYTPGAGNIW